MTTQGVSSPTAPAWTLRTRQSRCCRERELLDNRITELVNRQDCMNNGWQSDFDRAVAAVQAHVARCPKCKVNR